MDKLPSSSIFWDGVTGQFNSKNFISDLCLFRNYHIFHVNHDYPFFHVFAEPIGSKVTILACNTCNRAVAASSEVRQGI